MATCIEFGSSADLFVNQQSDVVTMLVTHRNNMVLHLFYVVNIKNKSSV